MLFGGTMQALGLGACPLRDPVEAGVIRAPALVQIDARVDFNLSIARSMKVRALREA